MYFVIVPSNFIITSVIDAALRLGDIYDCTLGYRQQGVSIYWRESKTGRKLNNPLMLTDQLINNSFYTCFIRIDSNPTNCHNQGPEVYFQLKGNFNLILMFKHFYRYLCGESDDQF